MWLTQLVSKSYNEKRKTQGVVTVSQNKNEAVN